MLRTLHVHLIKQPVVIRNTCSHQNIPADPQSEIKLRTRVPLLTIPTEALRKKFHSFLQRTLGISEKDRRGERECGIIRRAQCPNYFINAKKTARVTMPDEAKVIR